MKKRIQEKKPSQKKLTIKLARKVITIGPGTVPRSPGSVEKTDMKAVIKASKKAAELGIWD